MRRGSPPRNCEGRSSVFGAGGQQRGVLFALFPPPGGDAQLCGPGDADRQDQECTYEGRPNERNRHRHLIVSSRNTQNGGNGDGHPGPPDARVADTVSPRRPVAKASSGDFARLASVLPGFGVAMQRWTRLLRT